MYSPGFYTILLAHPLARHCSNQNFSSYVHSCATEHLGTNLFRRSVFQATPANPICSHQCFHSQVGMCVPAQKVKYGFLDSESRPWILIYRCWIEDLDPGARWVGGWGRGESHSLSTPTDSVDYSYWTVLGNTG